MLMISLLLACGPRHGGTGVEGAYCEESATELGLDEASPLGFAAASVLAYTSGEQTGIFTWGAGGESDAVVSVAAADSARFVDGESVYPDPDAEPITCPDRVEIDATVAFATDDGSFDEHWDLALIATDDLALGFSTIIENGTFEGTYDLEEAVYDLDYDHLRARAEGAFDASGGTGSLYGEASGTQDCADSASVCYDWTETIDVGSWATTAG